MNFFVYNSTSGATIDNSTINCTFYMADDKGEVINSGRVNYNPNDYWDYLILGGNFSELGIYSYGINCANGENTLGGTYVNYFEVTPSGQGGTANMVFFIFIIILLYTLTFIGFFGRNIPITILGGMALLFLGIYLINYGIIIYRDNLTNYIAYITIAVGAITAFWATLEQFEVL